MKNLITSLFGESSSSLAPKDSLSPSVIQSNYNMAGLEAYRDQLRAALCNQVMDHAAILAKAEEHYLRMAPGGKEEYRQITKAYVYKSVCEIMKGG